MKDLKAISFIENKMQRPTRKRNKKRSIRKVITFNHIDKSLSPEQLNELKDLYRYYHKLFWCHKKTFKRRQLALNILSSVCIAVGGAVGAARWWFRQRIVFNIDKTDRRLCDRLLPRLFGAI